MHPDTTNMDYIAHIIQVALTPVFLLAGIATLLNAFSARLGRVADRVDLFTAALESADHDRAERIMAQLNYLRLRSLVLDAAVVVAATGGALTCAATLVLFLGILREQAGASLLFSLFGLAVICTIVALMLFVIEMLLAGRGLRAQVARR